jgi:hypothetical protein
MRFDEISSNPTALHSVTFKFDQFRVNLNSINPEVAFITNLTRLPHIVVGVLCAYEKTAYHLLRSQTFHFNEASSKFQLGTQFEDPKKRQDGVTSLN